ncbi:MAG: beta-ketoacyl-[acyl-carrier-protein] synthase family protein [Leptonema sp. (in: Bacteria)]|nr:beta-ketoacyl-[acyl-carrier-protein] synthase family protein [Leptonema sp. (in: bacteria)]
MSRRVVVTGVGVITSNGHGKQEFSNSLRAGKSGIRFRQELTDLNFSCQVGGWIDHDILMQKASKYFTEENLLAMNEIMILAGIASIDAWNDAGFEVTDVKDDHVNWDAGCIVGLGLSGIETIAEKVIPKIDQGKVKRLGSTMVEQIMASSVSAKIGGLLALGNQSSTNSSACNTGTEAIIMGYDRIRHGDADRMVVGGAESSSKYVWGSFDAMKVLSAKYNDTAEKASRPMSASNAGFVPGSGSGILLLESLESAQKRGAKIYAEVLGAHLNCGGHRNGGSMTFPNPESVQMAIKEAVRKSGIQPSDIDAINGHLTATMADPIEVNNWYQALGLPIDKFPKIQSTKSMIGHCLGAAGSIESAAVMYQLEQGFLHKSVNCEDLHEKIQPFEKSVLQETIEKPVQIMAKASFGFGDVNGCVIYKKWNDS